MVDATLAAQLKTLALYILALVTGTIVHEFGHALAGWVVGREPRLVSVGRGPILLRFRCLGAWIVLRALPISGFAQSLVRPGMTPLETALVFAGGPLANLILLAPALVALAAAGFSPEASLFYSPWLVAQAVILASTLFPREKAHKDYRSVSDGLKLYRIWKDRDAFSFERLHAGLVGRRVPEGTSMPPASPAFPELAFQLARRDRKQDRWAQRDAEASMRRILARDDLPDAERDIADNLLKLLEARDRLFGARPRLKAPQKGL